MGVFTLSLWENFRWGLIYFDQFIYSKDSNQSDCTSSLSDQSLSFTTEETLDPLLPIERTSKTLTRGCGCAG